MNEENINLAPNMNVSGEKFEQCVKDTLKIMKQLMLTIDDENKALTEHNFVKVKAVAEDKARLAEAYAKIFEKLKTYKVMFKTLDGNLKTLLEKGSAGLAKRMQKNKTLLEVGKNASERVMDIIVKSAMDAEQKSKGFYSSNGVMGDKGRYRSALSINQEF